MATESQAAFKSRALDLGLDESRFQLMLDAGIRNFGQYAFICQYQPGSADETPLLKALSEIFTPAIGELTVGERAIMRRLYFESHTTAVQEMRIRLEAKPDDTPKQIPMAERIERINLFKQQHSHLVMDYALEPSHKLVDLVCAQAESQVVSYIELSLCTSREAEITHRKREPHVSVAANGTLQFTKQERELKIDISGDLRIRQCMQRRAIAYHLANIASYKVLEEFTTKLFHYLAKEPIANYKPVSIHQVIQADRELWIQVSQQTRGKILTASPKPIDEAIEALTDSTTVMYHLLPLPQGPASSQKQRPAERSRSPRRTKGKGKGKSKSKQSPPKLDIPPHCVTRDKQNRNLCFAFQWGKCKHPGPRCSRGMHNCWLGTCLGDHPYNECPKKE